MALSINCAVCGTPRKVEPRLAETARFCSRACQCASRRSQVTRNCARCGRAFLIFAYRARTALYCSRLCARGPSLQTQDRRKRT